VGSPRWWRLAILGVFLLALAVRLAIVFEAADAPYHRFLALDAATYHRIALTGDPAEPFWQPPLYPWFLRGLYALAGGPSPLLARLVQALAGALTAVLTALVARRFAGPGWSAGAGAAVALYAPLATLDAELLPASLATFLVTAFVLQLLAPGAPGSRARRLRLPLAGALLGAAGILLPPLGLAAALALAWLARREGWRPALLVGLIALLPAAGVTLRNRSYERALVPVSWNGGTNLWIGNNPDYPETVGIRPGVRWTRLMEAPRCEAGAATRAAEAAWFSARARAFALSDPLGFSRNLLWKAAGAVSAVEIGRNRDDYDARGESLVVRLLLWPWGFPFVVLFPLAAAGTAALARERKGTGEFPGLPLLVALGVLAISVIFFPTARYRAPAIPMLIVLAAAGLPRVRRHPGAAAATGAAALAVALVPHGIPPIPAGETLYEIGVDLDMDGRTPEALPFLAEAARGAPDNADVALYLGLVLGKLERGEEARLQLERAVALAPDADAGWQALAVTWQRRGDRARARAMIERAVAANGCNRRARALYAQVLMDAGELEGARRQLDEAERVYPRPDPFVARARQRLAQLSGPAPPAAPPRPSSSAPTPGR
jgi:thioredoxin-like negative regulator of GroEL